MSAVKFMYNGIKIDGKLYRGHWSNGPWVEGVNPAQVTFYRKDYGPMPSLGLPLENESDSRTDYFEKDRIRFTPGKPFYAEALAACKLQEEKRNERRMAKENA